MTAATQEPNGTTPAKDESKTSQDTEQNGSAGKTATREDGKDNRTFLQRYAFWITLMLSAMVDGLGYAVRGQYKYRFFHAKYEDELAEHNTTSGCGVKPPPEVQAIENKITYETTQWNLYELYITIVPVIIADVVIGMKSDQIGRRFLFLVSFFTSVIDFTLLAVIIRLNLHYGYSLIGLFVFGVSGASDGIIFASLALVSDTHGKRKSTSNSSDDKKAIDDKNDDDDDNDMDMSREYTRTFKIVLVYTIRKLASAMIAFATGYIIQFAGFFYTAIIVIAWKVGLFVFAFAFVTETGQQKKSTGFVAPLRYEWFEPFRRATKNPRKRLTLLLVNLGLLFSVFSLVDEVDVLRTYQMSPPFCFTAVQLGWFNSENRLKGVMVIPLMWVWRKLHMTESTIAAVGLLSSAGGALLLAVVRETWVFWARDLTISMAKAIISRMIGRNALASTFAVLMAAENMFWFAGSNATNYLYKASLDTVPTAPFYLAFASFVFSSLIFIVQTIHQRLHPDAIADSTDTEKSVKTDEEESTRF
ncbi:hypothetical protein BaRGS_00033777 [Batillaria attramentaria]|uniref:Solute carrier family 40 protein n=1 Tax=Batillaria attramentaria TaxID=370345 RepID=A0ABD0JJA8_9CAEN